MAGNHPQRSGRGPAFRLRDAADALLQQALVGLDVGVVVADVEGAVVFVNRIAEQMTGWPEQAAIGQRLEVVFHLSSGGDGGGAEAEDHSRDLSAGGVREEGRLVSLEGDVIPVEYSVSSVRDPAGRALGLLVAFRNVSEERLMSLRLARVARYDLLTGLLNRHSFLEHLQGAIDGYRARREEWVVAFLDLDQFKLVNDTCGHGAGDELLLWVAELLRELAGEHDVIARLGGDEFALLIHGTTLEGGVAFVEDLQRRMREYLFTWDDKSFNVTAGFGVAPVAEEFSSAAQLLSAVDHACYVSKESGRDGLEVCEHPSSEVAQRRADMDWMARINQQLSSGKVRLYAQPIRPLSPMSLRGLQFEVLLRMVEPDGRVRTPGDLVRAAEKFGLMSHIDRWVIHNALRILRDLDHDGLSRVHLCCINLSGVSLGDHSVVDEIRAELGGTGIPPQKVCFEITETAAVRNLEQAQWLMQELGSIGCNLAIDDFGTGVASYRYLKELPVNYLKIAGSFVEGMSTSDLDRAMVESINQLSHMLGVETVAENVGTRELYDHVRAIGLDHAQGYWIGIPRPFHEVCRPQR